MNRRTPATALFAVIALVIVVVLLAPATMGGVKKITTRPGVVTPPVFDVDDTGVPVTPPGGQLVPLPTPVPVPTNPQDLALHDTMRHLWMDHVVWSRNVTMGVFSDLKGVGDYEARLAMNTYDLTALLTPYFGKVNAATFEGLFMQHVTIASEVFQAYKEGNETFRDVSYRWYQNADEISAFLTKINPAWDYEEMRTYWKMHLDMVIDEMIDYKSGDSAGDVMCYDAAQDHADVLADFMTNGLLAKQATGK